MNVTHILPTKFLHLSHARGVKPCYHLVLSHIVANDPQYSIWHKEQSLKGAYVILDNGVEEKGTPDSVNTVIVRGHDIGAREIVLPDVMRDGAATIEMVNEALSQNGEVVSDCRKHGVKLAAVAQGVDRQEWIDCFDELNTDERIDTVMIPKLLDEVWGYGGRFAACSYLRATGRVLKYKQYHLLGVWTDPLEIYLQSVHNPWIRSVDTALAFHAGYQGVSVTDIAQGRVGKPKRPGNYFSIDWISPEQSALIVSNIETLDLWGASYGQHKSVTRKV